MLVLVSCRSYHVGVVAVVVVGGDGGIDVVVVVVAVVVCGGGGSVPLQLCFFVAKGVTVIKATSRSSYHTVVVHVMLAAVLYYTSLFYLLPLIIATPLPSLPSFSLSQWVPNGESMNK